MASRRWPHIRAALVAFHCLAVVLVALPAPTGTGYTLSVDDPTFAAEIRPWARLFHASDRSFVERLVAIRSGWLGWRGRLVGPFERYLLWVGAQQPWQMFSTPNRAPGRFVLELRPEALADEESGWEFLSGLPSGQWQRGFFESERTRGLLNVIDRFALTELADQLCLRVARDALAAHPDQAQARCRFIDTPAPSWRGPVAGEPRVAYRRVVGR